MIDGMRRSLRARRVSVLEFEFHQAKGEWATSCHRLGRTVSWLFDVGYSWVWIGFVA